jgi:hypothetical protein
MRESSNQYRQELSALARKIPAYEELEAFIETSYKADPSLAKISTVCFNVDGPPVFEGVPEDTLGDFLETACTSKLFIVENVSSNVIQLLGSHFGVEYDFWLDYVSNLNLFRLGDIEKYLPALKSVRLNSRHVRHRFIGPRELLLRSPNHLINDLIEPEAGIARVTRTAGVLNPLERLPHRSQRANRPKDRFPVLALTRQHASIWFDTPEGGTVWKTGTLFVLFAESRALTQV